MIIVLMMKTKIAPPIVSLLDLFAFGFLYHQHRHSRVLLPPIVSLLNRIGLDSARHWLPLHVHLNVRIIIMIIMMIIKMMIKMMIAEAKIYIFSDKFL